MPRPATWAAETWRSPDGTRSNANLLRDNQEALRAFSAHPKHLEAKRQYTQWYKGFHIVISQVLRSYGDGNIA